MRLHGQERRKKIDLKKVVIADKITACFRAANHLRGCHIFFTSAAFPSSPFHHPFKTSLPPPYLQHRKKKSPPPVQLNFTCGPFSSSRSSGRGGILRKATCEKYINTKDFGKEVLLKNKNPVFVSRLGFWVGSSEIKDLSPYEEETFLNLKVSL